MTPSKREQEVLEEFDKVFADAFSRNNPVIQAKGHYEKEYLHKTYPAHASLQKDGSWEERPAKFDTSRTVSEGAVDEREIYVTEKQWRMDEVIKEFLLQKLQEERKIYQEALIWCSGSEDFQLEGKARKGWEKMCKPLISD